MNTFTRYRALLQTLLLGLSLGSLAILHAADEATPAPAAVEAPAAPAPESADALAAKELNEATQDLKAAAKEVDITINTDDEPEKAASPSVGGEIVALAGAVMPFLTAILIVGMVFYFKDRRQKQRHETIRLALEKGQTLPPELFEAPKKSEPSNDLRSGLTLLGVGIGLYFFLDSVADDARWISLIVGLVGVARLAYWYFEGRHRPKA